MDFHPQSVVSAADFMITVYMQTLQFGLGLKSVCFVLGPVLVLSWTEGVVWLQE